MKFKTGLLLSWVVLACTANLARAEATDDEAARLATLFESYLTDTEGVVSVEPDGDGYKVKLDIAPLTGEATKGASLAGDAGASIKVSPIEFKMASEGDGKWQITEDQTITLSMEIKGQLTAEEKIGSLKATGTFDEKLNYFSKLTGEATDISISEKVTDANTGAGDISASLKSLKIDQTGAAAANGGVDVDIKYTLDGLTENINTVGKPEAGMPPVNVVVTAAGGNYELNGKGLKAKSIFDLLSFFVAHQSKEEISKDQTSLKTTLTDGIPLWENLAVNGKINTVLIASQFGKVGIDNIEAVTDANGIVKDGKFREKIAFNGLNLPAALIPPWATKLVPKNVGFDFTVSGFDLASPAQLLLTQLDLAKEPPVPAGFEQLLMPAFMPKGTVDITLNPTSVDNETYSVKVEGSMTAGPAARPSGKASISMKGLDEVMKLIQTAPPEAGLGGGMAMIIAAKGIGKAGADGSISWNIESTPDGKVLVNGIDPTTLGK